MSQKDKHDARKELAQVMGDLAVLADGSGVNLHVSFEAGLITIRSEDRILWSSGLERAWAVVDGPARATLVVKWLHDVAERIRELERAKAMETEEAA